MYRTANSGSDVEKQEYRCVKCSKTHQVDDEQTALNSSSDISHITNSQDESVDKMPGNEQARFFTHSTEMLQY